MLKFGLLLYGREIKAKRLMRTLKTSWLPGPGRSHLPAVPLRGGPRSWLPGDNHLPPSQLPWWMPGPRGPVNSVLGVGEVCVGAKGSRGGVGGRERKNVSHILRRGVGNCVYTVQTNFSSPTSVLQQETRMGVGSDSAGHVWGLASALFLGDFSSHSSQYR